MFARFTQPRPFTQPQGLLGGVIHLVADSLIEDVGTKLAEGITGATHTFSQFGRQALIEGDMLHVDGHSFDVVVLEVVGQTVRLVLWRSIGHGHITRAIGEQNHQRNDVRVEGFLALDGFIGQQQSRRKRCLATYGDVRQRLLRQCDRVGGGQNHAGAVFLEHNQPHTIPALIGIGQAGT